VKALLAFAVLLAACSDKSEQRERLDSTWNDVAQGSEIEALKLQVADLRKQDEFYDNEITALVQTQDALGNQVSANAKAANKNDKIDDARWEVTRARLGIQ